MAWCHTSGHVSCDQRSWVLIVCFYLCNSTHILFFLALVLSGVYVLCNNVLLHQLSFSCACEIWNLSDVECRASSVRSKSHRVKSKLWPKRTNGLNPPLDQSRSSRFPLAPSLSMRIRHKSVAPIFHELLWVFNVFANNKGDCLFSKGGAD